MSAQPQGSSNDAATTTPEQKDSFPSQFKRAIEMAEQNNKLLKALMTHPKMNRSDPLASPKPLFFATDFVRRTYLEYLRPILPRDAWKKSPIFANIDVFAYEPLTATPFPQPLAPGEMDTFLYTASNWPAQTTKWNELFGDCLTRTIMVPMLVMDAKNPKTKAMLGGEFDFKRPVDIHAIAMEIMPGQSPAEVAGGTSGGDDEDEWEDEEDEDNEEEQSWDAKRFSGVTRVKVSCANR